jgi:hypothetical protein
MLRIYGTRSTTSTSKIRNITPRRKNRNENGVRELLIESKPHSNEVNFAHSVRHLWEIQNAPKTMKTATTLTKIVYKHPTIRNPNAPPPVTL